MGKKGTQIKKGLDLPREVQRQNEDFLKKFKDEGEREEVRKLIQEYKLIEHSVETAEILTGRRPPVPIDT